MIGTAVLAGLGLHHNTEEDKGGGGGAAKPEKQEEKKPEEKPKGTKLELSPEELAKKLDDARASAKAEFDALQKKNQEAAEAEAARKRGEFEKLYQGEAARVKELESQVAAARLEGRKQAVALKLQRHLAANHKDYVENDIDILPHVTIDAETPDDEIEKRIKAATDAFVKRTPKASPLNGAPIGARRGKLEGGEKGDERLSDRKPERIMGPASRF
jgi:hypothetical protein